MKATIIFLVLISSLLISVLSEEMEGYNRIGSWRSNMEKDDHEAEDGFKDDMFDLPIKV